MLVGHVVLVWRRILRILGYSRIYGVKQSQKTGKEDNNRQNGR